MYIDDFPQFYGSHCFSNFVILLLINQQISGQNIKHLLTFRLDHLRNPFVKSYDECVQDFILLTDHSSVVLLQNIKLQIYSLKS